MKKNGFTIAEILITLGIIGVVAALTIPQLSISSQRKVYANKLSAAVSDLENAMTTMVIKENVDSLDLTPAWKGDFSNNLNKYFPHKELLANDEFSNARVNLDKKADVDFGGSGTGEGGGGATIKNNKGFVYSISTKSYNPIKESQAMSNGTAITQIVGIVDIDVNGKAKPNMWGRDSFTYYLDTDGHLYPTMGQDAAVYLYLNNITIHPDFNSPGANMNEIVRKECVIEQQGRSCSAYLANNGYKMDY